MKEHTDIGSPGCKRIGNVLQQEIQCQIKLDFRVCTCKRSSDRHQHADRPLGVARNPNASGAKFLEVGTLLQRLNLNQRHAPETVIDDLAQRRQAKRRGMAVHDHGAVLFLKTPQTLRNMRLGHAEPLRSPAKAPLLHQGLQKAESSLSHAAANNNLVIVYKRLFVHSCG